MANKNEVVPIATDWGIKYLPREIYYMLIYYRDKYFSYKLKGKKSDKLKADWANKVYGLFYTVDSWYSDFLATAEAKNAGFPSAEEYEKLGEYPLPDDKEIRRLERCLDRWFRTKGPFATTEAPVTRYGSVEEQYEDEA